MAAHGVQSGDELRCDVVLVADDERLPFTRFGDGANGMRPVTDSSFTAFYRVGNGMRGNVGADSIAHIAATVTA